MLHELGCPTEGPVRRVCLLLPQTSCRLVEALPLVQHGGEDVYWREGRSSVLPPAGQRARHSAERLLTWQAELCQQGVLWRPHAATSRPGECYLHTLGFCFIYLKVQVVKWNEEIVIWLYGIVTFLLQITEHWNIILIMFPKILNELFHIVWTSSVLF